MYDVIFLVYYREKERVSLAENNPLNALIPASTSHLSPSHIRFVFHWVGLLKLDETEKQNESSIDISDIWYIDAAIRYVNVNVVITSDRVGATH